MTKVENQIMLPEATTNPGKPQKNRILGSKTNKEVAHSDNFASIRERAIKNETRLCDFRQ